MKAVTLRKLDDDYHAHLTAWLTMKANAKKSAGKNRQKPVYQKFTRFFNFARERKERLRAFEEKKG